MTKTSDFADLFLPKYIKQDAKAGAIKPISERAGSWGPGPSEARCAPLVRCCSSLTSVLGAAALGAACSSSLGFFPRARRRRWARAAGRGAAQQPPWAGASYRLPWGAWVFVHKPHHFILLRCLLQGTQEGQELRIELLVALGECHGAEVRVLRWGGCGLVLRCRRMRRRATYEPRAHRRSQPRPPSAQVSRRSRNAPGTPVLPDGGAAKGGLEGTSNSLILIYKKMAEAFLGYTAFRPYFLADRPISSLTVVHLARPRFFLKLC